MFSILAIPRSIGGMVAHFLKYYTVQLKQTGKALKLKQSR